MPRLEDVNLRGTRASQPAANAVATGSIYYVTDEFVTERSNGSTWDDISDAGTGAPADADYLVGTSNGNLSNEIVVGTTPGGELGGTWGTPTVDATHSGSTHTAIPYTPSPDNDDWTAETNPGSAQDAIDQLAARVAVLERAAVYPADDTTDVWERLLEQPLLYCQVILPTTERALTGNLTLTTDDATYQFIDGNGSDRDITSPTEFRGLNFVIQNISDTETLTFKSSAAATITTIAAGSTKTFIYTTTWRYM